MIRVKAIRENKLVGKGSCSTVDECYSDKDLLDELNAEDIDTDEKAIKWAISEQLMYLEDATNYRWGEDSDQEVTALKHFRSKMKKYRGMK